MTGLLIFSVGALAASMVVSVALSGWRSSAVALLDALACGTLIGGWLTIANLCLSVPGELVALAIAIAGVGFGRTPLGLLNFLLLQWLGIRLQAAFETGDLPRRDGAIVIETGRWWSRHAPRGVRVSWSLLRWVWPLTGWWSEYRWIARRR